MAIHADKMYACVGTQDYAHNPPSPQLLDRPPPQEASSSLGASFDSPVPG